MLCALSSADQITYFTKVKKLSNLINGETTRHATFISSKRPILCIFWQWVGRAAKARSGRNPIIRERGEGALKKRKGV